MRRFALVEIPVPARGDYRALIEAAVSNIAAGVDLQPSSLERAFIDSTSAAYVRAFADTDGLVGDFAIGPGIPLSMIKYTKTRCEGLAAQSTTLEPARVFLEAVDALLLPQFEGRSKEAYDALDASLAAAFGELTADELERTSLLEAVRRSLKLWRLIWSS